MALRRVFTYLGAVFLMSYIIFSNNVFAADIDIPVKYVAGYHYPYWQSNNGESWKTGAMSVGNNLSYSSILYARVRTSSNTNITVTGGDYVSFIGFVDSGSALINDTAYSVSSQATGYFGLSADNGSDCQVVDFTYNNQDYYSSSGGYRYRYNFEYTCRASAGVTVTNPRMNFYARTVPNGSPVTIDFSIQRMNIFRPTSNSYDDTQLLSLIRSLNASINSLGDKIDDLGDHIDSINQDSADATQDSVDQSQQAGNSSQSDAQTGTSSLISTIGSAVSAITSASPTNCLLNGNMGNFDMGQIDLCANPVPAFVQIIGSLILILVTVPLCIVLFNRFIGLFRSFQG